MLPFVVWAQDQTVNNGQPTAPVTFKKGCNYDYTVTGAQIGLTNGIFVNTIPSFTAVNPGTAAVTSVITPRPTPSPANETDIIVLSASGRALIYPEGDFSNGYASWGATLQSAPYGIAISPDNVRVYITNNGNNSVSYLKRIYTPPPPPGGPNITYYNLATIKVGAGPKGIAISPDGGKLYVANSDDGSVSVIDTKTNTITATINNVGLNLEGIALNADGSRAYVAVSGSNYVAVINTATNTLMPSINVGAGPVAIVANQDGSHIYVACRDAKKIAVINTANNQVSSINLSSSPSGLALTPDDATLYATHPADNKVSVINTSTNTVSTVVQTGAGPGGISVTPDGKYVYIENQQASTLTVLDASTNTVAVTLNGDYNAPFSLGNFILGSNGCPVPSPINITVKPTPPTIIATGTLPPLTTSFGVASASASFNVSALSLTAGIQLIAPGGFELSTDNITFSNTLTVGAAGNVAATTIYVRLSATASEGVYSGIIQLTSPGAATVNVNATGTVTAARPVLLYSQLSGSIYTCNGTPSHSPDLMQFQLTGVALTGVATVSGSAGFEVSTSATTGFASSIDVANPGNTVIYVRASGSGLGSTNGTITLFSRGAVQKTVPVNAYVFPLPSVDNIPDQTFTTTKTTPLIHFTGTGNSYQWAVDQTGYTGPGQLQFPGLGLSGKGDIQPFTPGTATINPPVYHINVTPVSTPLVYVTRKGANLIDIIDPSINQVIGNIPAGLSPGEIILDAGGTKAYVASPVAGTISVVDINAAKVTATITVGNNPSVLMLSTDGKTLQVFNAEDQTISNIDLTTNTVISTAEGTLTKPPLLSPDGSRTYIVGTASNTVVITDTKTGQLIKSIPVGLSPQEAALSTDGSILYVTCAQSNFISVINTATFEEAGLAIPVEDVPTGIVFSRGSGCSGSVKQFTITLKPAPPEITAAGNPVSLTTVQGFASPITLFSVSGIRMAEGVLVTPPPGFEVSTDGINFNTTVTVPLTSAQTITSSPVYIRLAATTLVGNYSGDIKLTSPGADPVIVAMPLSTVTQPVPTIQTSIATGNIYACEGSPSESPNVQGIPVSGLLLTGNITVTAPAGFEVSLNDKTGFSGSVTVLQSGGKVPRTTVYVRSAASAKGSISGDVSVKSVGADPKTVSVSAVIHPTPKIDPVQDQTVSGGVSTQAVTFTGNAKSYIWSNDDPSIGLAGAGNGDIASFTAINTGSVTKIATITAVPVYSAYAYVAMYNTARLFVINTANNTTVTTINVGNTPYAVSVSRDGKYVYVANQASGYVSVVDAASNQEISKITVGSKPSGVVVSPDGKFLYVSNNGNDNITAINLSTKATTTIKVGLTPEGITISPDGQTVYVANRNSNTVSVINTATNTVTANITVGLSPQGIACSTDGTRVYVTNYNSKSVTVIDALSNAVLPPAIAVGTNPHGIAVSPDGKTIYVANTGSGDVSVVNTATNTISTINVGGTPQGISVSPDATTVYVTNNSNNSIAIINTKDNTVSRLATPGLSALSFGNFVAGGTLCTGDPIKFKITVNPSGPTILYTASFLPLSTQYGTPSASAMFSVSAVAMKEGILITPPTGFEISLNNVDFKNSLNVGSAGAIAPVTIYIRLAATASAGTHTGDILLSSNGAIPVKVNITNNTVTPAPLTVKPDNATKSLGATLTGGPGSKAFTYTGIQNQETIGSVTVTYGKGSEASAAMGVYTGSVIASLATGGTFNPANYDTTYLAADLTVSQELGDSIPNSFTPNGDGINDQWVITLLLNFPDCTVEVFSRNGGVVFHSAGYSIPWDGTYNGHTLPSGTYYYVINLHNGKKPVAGRLTIIK